MTTDQEILVYSVQHCSTSVSHSTNKWHIWMSLGDSCSTSRNFTKVKDC